MTTHIHIKARYQLLRVHTASSMPNPISMLQSNWQPVVFQSSQVTYTHLVRSIVIYPLLRYVLPTLSSKSILQRLHLRRPRLCTKGIHLIRIRNKLIPPCPFLHPLLNKHTIPLPANPSATNNSTHLVRNIITQRLGREAHSQPGLLHIHQECMRRARNILMDSRGGSEWFGFAFLVFLI